MKIDTVGKIFFFKLIFFFKFNKICLRLVRFTMSWSEAISHIRPPKTNITSKKPIEEIKIIYQFYYQNRARVLNETRSSSSCVWCEKQLFTVSNLLTHLNASHDRFLYSTPELKAIQSKMKIPAVHIEVGFFFNLWIQFRLFIIFLFDQNCNYCKFSLTK